MRTFSSVEVTGLDVKWDMLHSLHPDVIGLIPMFISAHDERPAAEQFADNYMGGWDSFKGFTMDENGVLSYPSDPPLLPIAIAHLGNETIRVYEYGWVSIQSADGSFDVARLD